jgi:hypothetical protein
MLVGNTGPQGPGYNIQPTGPLTFNEFPITTMRYIGLVGPTGPFNPSEEGISDEGILYHGVNGNLFWKTPTTGPVYQLTPSGGTSLSVPQRITGPVIFPAVTSFNAENSSLITQSSVFYGNQTFHRYDDNVKFLKVTMNGTLQTGAIGFFGLTMGLCLNDNRLGTDGPVIFNGTIFTSTNPYICISTSFEISGSRSIYLSFSFSDYIDISEFPSIGSMGSNLIQVLPMLTLYSLDSFTRPDFSSDPLRLSYDIEVLS